MFSILPQSHENERRLLKKVKEMNNELATMGAKVAHAMKLSEDDDTMVSKLRKQIDTLYVMVDTATAKEEEAQATIARLQGEVQSLTEVVDRYTSLVGEDTSLEDVIATRDELARKHAQALEAIRHEQERADDMAGRAEAQRAELEERKAGIAELRSELRSKSDELSRELKKRESVEKQLASARADVADRAKVISRVQTELDAAKGEARVRLDAVSDAKAALKEQMLEFHEAQETIKRMAQQLKEMESRCDSLTAAKLSAEKEATAARGERTQVDSEKRRLESKLKAAEGRIERVRSALDEERVQSNGLRSELAALQRGLDAASKDANVKTRRLERLQVDVEREHERVSSEQARVKELGVVLGEERTAGKKKEEQMLLFTRQAEKARNVIDKLTLQVQRMKQELLKAHGETAAAKAEIAAKVAGLKDAEKKESELLARLKQQQALYESVRADRNTYSKQLVEAQDEIAEMKRKFKVMQHQIEQLKEDMSAKDRALVAEHFEKKSVSKMLQQRTHENEELKRVVEESDTNAARLATELAELNAAIRRQDDEAAAQKRKLSELVTERDILGTQLIRRNDELALLYEKISILQAQLAKGETQYREQNAYIRMLRLKLKDLRRECTLATASVSKVGEVQRELRRAETELLAEKTKVKALSEELENPMNVHRWRRLEGSDPATFELIQKVQTLQKRLIAKTEEVVEKDMQLQEKDTMYMELKAVLARQPGPEVAEQLSHYQHKLSEKTRQLKALASELNMAQAQVNEFKFDADRLARELTDTKRKHYELKKRAASAGGRATKSGTSPTAGGFDITAPASLSVSTPAARLITSQRTSASAAQRKFVGGGFAVPTSS